MKVAILGGGVAGVTLARYLADDPRIEVDLHELTGRIGGLHRSEQIDGLHYDIGAFVFSPQHALFEAFPVLREAFIPFRLTQMSILPDRRQDRFPPSIGTYLRREGAIGTLQTLFSLGFARLRHRKWRSADAYCAYYLGDYAYRRTGLKHYVARLNARPGDQVDAAFAQQRLRDLRMLASPGYLLRSFARKLARRPDPLFFARPAAGFDAAYALVEKDLLARGVRVLKHSVVDRVETGESLALTIGATRLRYDAIISTIPLHRLAAMLGMPARYAFDSIRLLTLFYRFSGTRNYTAQILHNYSDTGRWKRVIDFSNIYGGEDRAWLSVEIPIGLAGTPDIAEECVQFEAHVREMGIFAGEMHFQGHAETAQAYPLYPAGEAQQRAADLAEIERRGIILAGRQGRFDYLSANETAGGARDLARRLSETWENQAGR